MNALHDFGLLRMLQGCSYAVIDFFVGEFHRSSHRQTNLIAYGLPLNSDNLFFRNDRESFHSEVYVYERMDILFTIGYNPW